MKINFNKISEDAFVDEINKIAEELSVSTEEGKSAEKGITSKDVSPDQLKKGIKVESEHTNNPKLQKKISLDHLAEFPKYYTALDKMEQELKGKK